MKKIKTAKVALIGSGMISASYLKNLKVFDAVELVGCSDIIEECAKSRAEEFGIRAMTNEEIFNDPEIEWIVNTTYPLSRYDIIMQSLKHNKNVYSEKLTTQTVEQANNALNIAESKGLFVGGAPDTFLGGGCQLARQIIDSGIIGKPVMVDAFLSRSYHHERFYTGNYKRFAFCEHGGIIFDMGSYYLTHMIFLLGAIKKVSGFAQIRNPDRKYLNPNSPLYGEDMTVESWNNVTGSIEFENGTLGHFTVTSESGSGSTRFIIHCTDGYIDIGDPNIFGSTVKIYNKRGEESILNSTHGYVGGDFRGIGLLDAIYAVKNGRKPRCSGELNRHVTEALLGMCNKGIYEMTTTASRPEPLAVGYTEYPELVFNI